jgi:lipoprotein signal peptidase
MFMPERTFRMVFWCLAVTGLLLDQASKYAVFSWLRGVEPNHAWVLFQTEDGSGFQLTAQFEHDEDGKLVPHVNHGALFGFLREHKSLANACFAFISLVAALAIIFWSTLKTTARDWWLCCALGLILGGTLGNLYDRIVFNGVRDFLYWSYGNWLRSITHETGWPVFNIADCCLVIGAGLLLIQAFQSQPVLRDKTAPAPVKVREPIAPEASGVR